MNSFFKKIEEYVLKKPLLFFIVLAFISLFIYRNTHLAGMVFDFNDWALIYEQKSLKDALNSFGYPGLHQLEQLVFFSFYKLFRFNTYAWYIIFALLHALAAYQVFLLLKILVRKENQVNFIAFGTAFLFLISPFAADTVVSKVTVHYLMSAVFIFASLRYYLLFQQKGKTSTFLISISLFTLSLFSLEIAYALPIAVILLYFRAVLLKTTQKSVLFTLSYLVILAAFLMLHKLVIGSFIGHYGAETHTKFDLAQLTANFFAYFSSYGFFFDFWTYQFKDIFYQLVYRYFYVFILLALVFIALVFRLNKRAVSINSLTFLGLFALFLLPILNLFLVYLHPIENDRYAYLASPFILAAIVYLFSFFSKKIRYLLFVFFSVCSLFFLQKNVQSFTNSGIVSQALLNDFRWEDKASIFILAQPENYNGARLFCSTDSNYTEFAAALFLQKGIDVREKTQLVYEMNISSLQDSVKVTAIDKQYLEVKIGDWGSWFWKHHNGATNISSLDFYTEVKENGLAFDVHFKRELQENDVVIYFNGTKWKELSF